jgi:hypothetical protein
MAADTAIGDTGMARIPLTAREQLLRARDLGHELSVHEAGPWPEYGDPHPKYWLRCSCGYESTARRSRKALSGTMAWHLGKVLGLEDERTRRDGLAPRRAVGD